MKYKQLKDYKLRNLDLMINFIKMSVSLSLVEQTTYIKQLTSIIPLRAIEAGIFCGSKEWEKNGKN